VDLSAVLRAPDVPADAVRRQVVAQDHGIIQALDNRLIEACRPALEHGERVDLRVPIRNVNRTVGTMLGSALTRRYGAAGLPEDTIRIHFDGAAGQSFGAFIPQGMTLELEGDANDYFGKGLSGGKLVVFPSHLSTFVAEENVIIGNVALYGATSGEAYVRGLAGERFGVRNSGALAVVEGIGDHGCEYMTGGRIVVIGRTGRNFAAGMSGGVAYVLDVDDRFGSRCNRAMVDFEFLEAGDEDDTLVKEMLRRHVRYTGSTHAAGLLENWGVVRDQFVKVMPRDYKRVLQAEARAKSEDREPAFEELVGVAHG
jgi:glutamate synthase (ferredoxin)